MTALPGRAAESDSTRAEAALVAVSVVEHMHLASMSCHTLRLGAIALATVLDYCTAAQRTLGVQASRLAQELWL